MSGMDYNGEKVDQGKAEITAIENFPEGWFLNTPTHSTCRDYLSWLIDRNTNVKNRQFHVAITCAGRELNKEQLTEVAKEYMQKMGYGDQPYVVFFHHDTDNNHIHIVSSRVRQNGTVISDSNERRRTQTIIRDIAIAHGYDPLVTKKEEADKIIKDILSWSFPKEEQVNILFERYGLKVAPLKKDPNILGVYSGRKKVGEFPKSAIEECIERYRQGINDKHNWKLQPKDRDPIYKRKGLIYMKLVELASKGLLLEDIAKIEDLRQSLGFEVVMHKNVGKDGAVYYNYAVMDYAGKVRFNGSDILSINTLTRNEEYRVSEERFRAVFKLVMEELGPRAAFSDVKFMLEEHGYALRKSVNTVNFGAEIIPPEVDETGKKKERKRPLVNLQNLFFIDREQAYKFVYWERVKCARELRMHSLEEARLLAAWFQVKLPDIIPESYESIDQVEFEANCQSLQARIRNVLDMDKQLQEQKAELKKHPKDEALNAIYLDNQETIKQWQKSLKEDGLVIMKQGEDYFVYSSQTGIAPLGLVIEEGLTKADLETLGCKIVDVENIQKYQSHWLKYINEIVLEGGAEGVEEKRDMSAAEYAQSLREDEKRASKEAWEQKRAEWIRRQAERRAAAAAARWAAAGRSRASGMTMERMKGEGRNSACSFVMDRSVSPRYLDGILSIINDLARHVGHGVGVGSSGRSRRRKREEDDDDD